MTYLEGSATDAEGRRQVVFSHVGGDMSMWRAQLDIRRRLEALGCAGTDVPGVVEFVEYDQPGGNASVKFCHHPDAVQTQEEHPGGVATYVREHRGRRHRVKRRYTEPMVIVERRCPDCPAYAAMTVQPGYRAAVQLAAWMLPDGAPGGTVAPLQEDADQVAFVLETREELCADCRHAYPAHQYGRCTGKRNFCGCRNFWPPESPGTGSAGAAPS